MTHLFSRLAAGLCSMAIITTAAAQPNQRPSVMAPTQADIAYGTEPAQRMDFYQAESAQPTPLLFVIHGGGWLHGDKRIFVERRLHQWVDRLMASGVSVVSVEYRMDPNGTLPNAVMDAARALQFVRSEAKTFNIDPDRIVATGSSAGGCSSLWLATHDDLADADSEDAVARQSTRLSGAWVQVPQTTIEPAMIREWVGEGAVQHGMIWRAGGFASVQDMDDNYESKAELYHEFSPSTHVTADDPPMLLQYSGRLHADRDFIHHARFGLHFKNLADERGATCHLDIRRDKVEGHAPAPSIEAFLQQTLNVEIAAKPE